jgi:hypothetical protein
VVSGLDNGSSYTFSVTATNKKGTSPASSPSNEVTPPFVGPATSEYSLDDQATWTEGSGPFGENESICGFDAAVSPFPRDTDIWVQVTFELPEGGLSGLQIVGTIDNVAEFFVNGQSLGSTAGGFCDPAFDPIPIPEELLQPGLNVLLVHAADDSGNIGPGDASYLEVTVEYTDPGADADQTAVTSSAPEETTTTTTSSTTTSSTTTSTTTTTTAPVEETTTTSTPSDG